QQELAATARRLDLHQLVETRLDVARVIRADLRPARRVEGARGLVGAVVTPSPERDLHRVAQVGLWAALADDGARRFDELACRAGDRDPRTAGVRFHEEGDVVPPRGRGDRPARLHPAVDL